MCSGSSLDLGYLFLSFGSGTLNSSAVSKFKDCCSILLSLPFLVSHKSVGWPCFQVPEFLGNLIIKFQLDIFSEL